MLLWCIHCKRKAHRTNRPSATVTNSEQTNGRWYVSCYYPNNLCLTYLHNYNGLNFCQKYSVNSNLTHFTDFSNSVYQIYNNTVMLCKCYYDGEYAIATSECCVIVARVVCCHFESPLPSSLFSNLHYMTETQSDMNYIIWKHF